MKGQSALCVHAHFYQPPREDPFSGRVLDEPGAEPYRNWNEKVLATCYAPNTEIGNFEHISFNFGPTLSTWLQKNAGRTLARVVAEDASNVTRFAMGNAMSQPFHHTILPLASRRDKETQVKWGIYAFSKQFRRVPQGMWLPETAVDYETMEVLTENGIEFTILAPWQVDRPDGEIASPFRVELKNGKSIIVFIFNRNLSTSISFNPAETVNADVFMHQFIQPELNRNKQQFLMIATDGELYGHHQPFREKFLHYLMTKSAAEAGISTTYPALWLKQHLVEETTRIIENTSWSCLHGVERWQGECGCSSSAGWKRPLREALDYLSLQVDTEYESTCMSVGIDPWSLRDDYVRVFLGDIPFDLWINGKLKVQADLSKIEKMRKLLLAEYECQRMFNSCAWFFDDLERIEPKNSIIYAAHAARLTEEATGINVSGKMIPLLEKTRNGSGTSTASDLFQANYSRFSLGAPRH